MQPGPGLIEVFAKTAFIEFLLEASYVQQAAQQNDPESFAKWRDGILDRVRFRMLVTGERDSGDVGLAVQEKMIEIAERFFARVESNAREARAELLQREHKIQSEGENQA